MTTTTTGGAGSGTSAGKGAASDRVHSWSNPLETIDLTSDDELYEFCEVGRQISRYFATIVELAAGDVKEGLEELGREGGHWALFGLDTRIAARRVAKHFERAGEDFESAAAAFFAAWKTFEHEFADKLAEVDKERRRKSFTIRGMS